MDNLLLQEFKFDELLQVIEYYCNKNSNLYSHTVKCGAKDIVMIEIEKDERKSTISCSICKENTLRKNDKEYYPAFISFILNDGKEDMRKLILFKEDSKYCLYRKKLSSIKFFDFEYNDIDTIKVYENFNKESILNILDVVLKEFDI